MRRLRHTVLRRRHQGRSKKGEANETLSGSARPLRCGLRQLWLKRRCLQALRPAFAQPLEMPVSRFDLGFAQFGFFAQQLTGGLDVASHEDTEGGLQALADALVERSQLGGAFW
jgi:hypothetical protein